MSFRLAANATRNGFVWILLRSTYTTFTTSRLLNFILPRRSIHVLPHSCGISNCVVATATAKNVGRRSLSTKITAENIPIATYDEIMDLPNHPEILLVDVRERRELRENGEIPDCINIPLGELTKALNLSEENFDQKYGKPKPTKSTKIIFYCQVGIRSGEATVTAADLGYTNVKNYKGSWNEYLLKSIY